MPATAGRVRMPANNRVHSSAALQTHGIWQSAIGYDPYAPTEQKKAENKAAEDDAGASAYDSFQGLLALAKLTGNSSNDTRGSCRKCNRVGHLTFQCRNFLTAKEEPEPKENGNDVYGSLISKAGPEDDSDESDVSDSDLDSELEAILAKKKSRSSGKVKETFKKSHDSLKKKKKKSSHRHARDADSDDESTDEERKRKWKERPKKRTSSSQKKEKKKKHDSEDDSDERRKGKKRSHKKRKLND